MTNYFYDEESVRYELYKTNAGKDYNWLFFPGGPGADSKYFRSLVDECTLPGNVWLIDLPGNGGNLQVSETYDFDRWISIFPKLVSKFNNPVLVGHSFGAMFPLLFPELENILKGYIIFNSVPTLWLEDALDYSKQFNLPDLTEEMNAFIASPSQHTFDAALDACAPYYFSAENLQAGKELLSELPFNYKPAVWWQKKVIELGFSAKWIPEDVPTTIIGSKYDCICPFRLFKNDARFQRQNIKFLFFENAGHIPWLERPEAMSDIFEDMIFRLEGHTVDV